LAVAAAVSLSLGAAARADLTQVKKTRKSEASQEQILEHGFGGDFVMSAGGYSNGSLFAHRIADDETGAASSLPGNLGGGDQRWSGDYSAKVLAAFSSSKQAFGLFDGGKLKDTISVSGRGFAATGEISSIGGDSITFGRGGDKKIFSSRNSLNKDHGDHLVSYEITGLSDSQRTFVLFWEDNNVRGKRKGDRDYNDLVVRLTADLPVFTIAQVQDVSSPPDTRTETPSQITAPQDESVQAPMINISTTNPPVDPPHGSVGPIDPPTVHVGPIDSPFNPPHNGGSPRAGILIVPDGPAAPPAHIVPVPTAAWQGIGFAVMSAVVTGVHRLRRRLQAIR
jgi:hypothetical protein